MRFYSKALSLILLAFVSAFGLKATITNQSGVPVPNVAVSFKKVDTTVFSDSLGVVNCDVITPIVSFQKSLKAATLHFNGSGFSLSLPKSEDVALSLYSPRGQRVMHYSEKALSGNHLILPPTIADGMYLMKLTVGEEQFTSKIVRGQSVHWQGNSLADVSTMGRASDFIDTITISKNGFLAKTKSLVTYDDDLGTITLDTVLLNENYFGLQKYDIDTTLPSFVNVLFRVYDSLGNNLSSITAEKLLIKEDGEPISSSESELTLETVSDFKDSTQTVLLIDNSKSVEANLPKIKAAAKEMIRNLLPRQQVAIYAFSENCTKMIGFSSDTTVLLQAIDAIPTGYASTNLYGSLIYAFANITNYASVKQKKIVVGNVILFTDGKDTQGSSTLSQVLSMQKDIEVLAIGLGEEVDLGMDALKKIAREKIYTTNDPDKLGLLFTEVQEKINNITNCYYEVSYRSPKRGDVDHILTVEIMGNVSKKNDAIISGTFNSKLFQAGWAPTASNLQIRNNSTYDTLFASYDYNDKDGETEGNSKYRWSINGVNSSNNSLAFPLNEMSDTDNVLFEVQPVSVSGVPKEGRWVSKKYTGGTSPIITNLNIELNTTKDSLIAKYDFSDIDGDLEGDSKFLWKINGGFASNSNGISVSELNDNDSISLEISPVSKTGLPNLGISHSSNSTIHFPLVTYGGPLEDCGRAIISTGDGYILAGETDSFGAGKKDVYLVKIGLDGRLLWEKTYGGALDDIATGITPSTDGYIVSGHTESFGAGDKDIWILKVTESGDTTWTKTFGTEQLESSSGICKVSDGVVILGNTVADSAHVWLLKLNHNGEILWSKNHGEKYFSVLSKTIVATQSGFVIVGFSSLNVSSSFNSFVATIDKFGNLLWDNTFGGSKWDVAYSVIEDDDGYIVVGNTESYGIQGTDLWIFKVDKNGNKVWEKIFGIKGVDCAEAIVKAENGYIITGYTNNTNMKSDIWVIKIDKFGNQVWSKTFGGVDQENALDLISNNGVYVISGLTESYGAGGMDLIAICIDENGSRLWDHPLLK